MPLLLRLRSFCLECVCNVVSIGKNGVANRVFFPQFWFWCWFWVVRLVRSFNGLDLKSEIGVGEILIGDLPPSGFMSLFASSEDQKFEVCPSSIFNLGPTHCAIYPTSRQLKKAIAVILTLLQAASAGTANEGPIRGGFLDLVNWPCFLLRDRIFCT